MAKFKFVQTRRNLCGDSVIFNNNIAGGTLNSLWLAMFPVMSILSISRILIVKGALPQAQSPFWLKVMGMIGWMYIAGVWMWSCVTQSLELRGVNWTYDYSKLGASTLSALELYLCFPSLGLTYIAYLVIVVHMEVTRSRTSNTFRRQEIKIFLQATFLCFYISTLIIMWHNAENWFVMNKMTMAILNTSWICFSYLNPTLLIAINPTIRSKVKKFFCDNADNRSLRTAVTISLNMSKIHTYH